MKWIVITSDYGKHIVPVQKWLFKKYAPDVRLEWIDLGRKHIKNWCANIHNDLSKMKLGKYVVTLLDDHLLIDRISRVISMPYELERLELGTLNSNHKGLVNSKKFYLKYENDTPYQVSTQPSIWRTDALMRVLKEVNGDPWNFEVNGRCTAGIVKSPIVRVIEESAISKRRPGKVNLCGMKQEDIKSLTDLKLINERDVIYGFKGASDRTKIAYGTKYKEFY